MKKQMAKVIAISAKTDQIKEEEEQSKQYPSANRKSRQQTKQTLASQQEFIRR